jgi:DNA-binding NtrC family response regulator
MRKLTLYIIDDEPEAVAALVQAIKPNKRFTVRGFTSAAEVRAAAETQPPHLAICDYLMPECDGIELLRELKGRFPRLRSVLLTGEGFSPAIVKGIEEGVFELYFAKPWNLKDLEEAMQRLAREAAKDMHA